MKAPNQATSSPAVPLRKNLRRLWTVLTLASALCLLCLAGLRLYFNGPYFQKRLEAALRISLGRQVEMGDVTAGLWPDDFYICQLRVHNAEAGFNDKDTFRCRNIHLHVALLSLLSGDISEFRDLKMEAWSPELILERRGAKTNIDDWLAPSQGIWRAEIAKLKFQLLIHDGLVRFTDNVPTQPTASVQCSGLELRAHTPTFDGSMGISGKGEFLAPEQAVPEEYQYRSGFDFSGSFSAPKNGWQGKGKISLANLTLLKDGGREETDWEKAASVWAEKYPGQTYWPGLALLLDCAYGDTFGLLTNKMEAEPFTIGFELRGSQLALAPGTITGLAGSRSAGLQIEYEGGLDLATLEFRPELSLWLAKLPPKTQRILGLGQLNAAERNKILREIEERKKLEPVVLKGRIMDNKMAFLKAFLELRSEIGKLAQTKGGKEAEK